MKYPLKVRQIALFFIAFLPIVKMFTMPKSATEASNENMWISVLINLIIDYVTILILIKVNKIHNKPFYQILKDKFGVVFAKTVLCFYLFYFLIKAFTPIFELRNFVQNSFYATSIRVFPFVPFFILSTFLCVKKLNVLGRLADLAWILTTIGVGLILFLSISNADFGAILPIINKDNDVIKGSFYTAPWFTDASYFLFMIGYYEKDKKSTLKLSLGFWAHGLLILLFSITFYCTFTFVAKREFFPLSEISKYSGVINAIGRFDYIAILMLLVTNTIAVALPLFFATKVAMAIFDSERGLIFAIIINLLQLVVATFFERYQQYVISIIHLKLSLFMFALGNLLPILLIFIKPKNSQALDKNNHLTKRGLV
jgi:hypothetical protein